MRWRVEHDTVETPEHVLHRLDCPLLDDDRAEGAVHLTGTLLERDDAPRECWRCRPDVLLVLSV